MELVSCLIHHMISLYFLLLFVKSWLCFTFELHLIPKAIVTENGLRETCLGSFVVELGSYDMWKSIIQFLYWLSGRLAWFLDWEKDTFFEFIQDSMIQVHVIQTREIICSIWMTLTGCFGWFGSVYNWFLWSQILIGKRTVHWNSYGWTRFKLSHLVFAGCTFFFIGIL